VTGSVGEPVEPETAGTALNDWFHSTLLNRQDDKRSSGLILIMQRLHVNDLTGLLQGGGDYDKLAFPAIAEKDEVIELRNGKTYKRRRGEALHPQREDVATLENMRNEIGSYLFESQYQQSPTTPEGTLFKRKYFQIIEAVPQWRGPGAFYISIDSAISTSSTADFTAITIAYCAEGKLCVVSAGRERWEYEALKEKVLRLIGAYARPNSRLTVVVEHAGTGISLAQYLHAKQDRRFRLLPHRPRHDKLVRAASVLAWFEPGIYLLARPGKSDWVVPYLNEFMTFPNGTTDDQVDSLVQLIYQNELRHKLVCGAVFTESSPD
jgi:predicted phage terminase large subunit-like protein